MLVPGLGKVLQVPCQRSAVVKHERYCGVGSAAEFRAGASVHPWNPPHLQCPLLVRTLSSSKRSGALTTPGISTTCSPR
jgi:hypothetical protein